MGNIKNDNVEREEESVRYWELTEAEKSEISSIEQSEEYHVVDGFEKKPLQKQKFDKPSEPDWWD